MNDLGTLAFQDFCHFDHIISWALASEHTHQFGFGMRGKALRGAFQALQAAGQGTPCFVFFTTNQPNICHVILAFIFSTVPLYFDAHRSTGNAHPRGGKNFKIIFDNSKSRA
jgi:hypothetical protein